MATKFKYQKRTKEQTKKRATQSGGSFDSTFLPQVNGFSAKEGDHTIRILPATWDDPEHFGYDIWVHYGIGPDNQSYICLKKMKDEPCPICDERAEAEKESNVDADYVGKLKPSKRVVVYLIDRDNEDDGPLVWGMPWTVDRDLASLCIDKKTGEVFCVDDPEEGFDLEFTREGAQLKTKYLGMKIARRDTPISADEDEAEKWLKLISDNPIPDMLNYFDYDYIRSVFAGKKAKSEDEEDDDEDESPRRRSKTGDDSKSGKRSREDEDEEEKPKKKSKSSDDEDEDEDKAKKRTPFKANKVEDDDDEDEKPKKRRVVEDEDDDDEDEKPKKKSKSSDDDDDDDEDEKPKKKSKPSDDEDDDEDEKPKKSEGRMSSLRERVQASIKDRKKSKSSDDDDDDDEDEKPKKKRRDDDEDEDE